MHRPLTNGHEKATEDPRLDAMREANQQLLLSALQAHETAESVARAMEAMSRQAALDPLTQLPGRLLLRDRLGVAIAHARRNGHRLALLFVDLDRYKQINDTYGHDVGDDTLLTAAACLRDCVRADDTVCRWGGDEFLVLLPVVDDVDDAARVARKILGALALPHGAAPAALRLTASIGIALYPDDADDATLLIRRADAAMYRAKHAGGDAFSHAGAAGVPPAGRPAAANGATAPPARGHGPRGDDALRQSHRRLLADTLAARAAAQRADAAMQRQQSFLAVLAHELRTPLQVLMSAGTLLERIGGDDAKVSLACGLVRRQVAHLSRLADDLVDTARVQTGKLRLQCRRLVLQDEIVQAVAACRPDADRRGQAVVLQLPSAPIEVDADPVRLMQVFTNVIGNAIKYTLEHGAITLTLALDGPRACVTVADNGIGIAAETLARVFEPFVQSTLAVGFDPSGLGLGLSLVRGLVRAHGGDVVVTSPGVGLGCRVELSLPAAASAPLAPAGDAAACG